MNFSLSHGLYCHQLSPTKAWSDRVQLGRVYEVCMYKGNTNVTRCAVIPPRIPRVSGRTKLLEFGDDCIN